MKVILTLLIMLWFVLWFFIYIYVVSLFLDEEEKYLAVPYWFCFLAVIFALVMFFLWIYNSL